MGRSEIAENAKLEFAIFVEEISLNRSKPRLPRRQIYKFIFNLPKVGIHSLGLTSFTSASGFDYYINGLENITDNINIDTFISDFNNAIKIIGVEINKMTAYRNICSLKEKQIKIHKDAKKCIK